ncbi:MAG: hypothetical protein K6L76_10190 [Agarilytica sp.]
MKILPKVKYSLQCLGFISGALVTSHTSAQLLDLADEPLFIQSSVQPNILFIIDDSGSMDWESTVNNHNISGLPDPGDVTQRSISMPPTRDDHALDLCPGFNTMAYNPERLYTPWRGVDEEGDAFDDITNLRYARSNPYDDDDTDDIRDHVYFLWNDADNDGAYDDGECPDVLPDGSVEITQTCRERCESIYTWTGSINWCINNRFSCGGDSDKLTTYTTGGGSFDEDTCRDDAQCIVVQDLIDAPSTEHGTASETQAAYINYANWYTYYRKRTYVAQRTLTELVYQSDARVGLGTLHDHDNVGTEIEDMRNDTSKSALLRQAARIDPSSGTPLRVALNNAGRYFESSYGGLFGNHSADDPILDANEGGTCQQNFTILMSDGFANGGNPPGIGDTDSTSDTVFDGGLYADGSSALSGNFSSGRTTGFLADVAMHYFERDLRPSLTNLVPENASRRIDNLDSVEDNMHQHMVTYTIAYGINGTLDCTPLVDDDCLDTWTGWDQATETGTTMWPGEISYWYNDEDPRTADDMRHAAFNGRGRFLSANNPDTLIASLEGAISDIEAVNSSSAAVAANSTTLNTETVVYQARFNTGDWHGDLIATPISSGTGDNRAACAGVALGGICNSNLWNAGTDAITNGINETNSDSRVVFTYSAFGGIGRGVNFAWPSGYPGVALAAGTIDEDFANALIADADTGDEDNYGEAIVDYLRGDQTNEVEDDGSYSSDYGFRQRENSILGDIINSEPRYVAGPSAGFPDDLEASAPYSDFETAYENRQAIVYVGANDGMLHAFDAATGAIELSYIPLQSHSNIANLADTDYQHKFFVDNAPTVGDAYFDGAWHTLLLGSHRAGGRGIFALDVTNPAIFENDATGANAENVVKWEFASAELGYTFAQPDLVKLNTASGEWAAIFGNGYNSDGTGEASLFVIDAETGGTNRNVRISTGEGTPGTPNGLSTTVPIDIDGDYRVDYVYAGDLYGNLWRFDLRAATPGSWGAVKVFETATGQPITTRPSVTYHPDPSKTGIMVYFGTGRYIDDSDNDLTSTDTQSFYGIWDDFTTPNLAHYTRSNLLARSVTSEIWVDSDSDGVGPDDADGDTDDVELRFTSDTGDIDWDTDKGWYLDLTSPGSTSNRGERQITNSVIRGGRIVFTTTIPNDAACDFGGTGFIMELDAEDGSPLDQAPLDFNSDGVIDANDLTFDGTTYTVPSGQGMKGLPTSPTVIGTTTSGIEVKAVANSRSNLETFIESTDPDQETTRTSWSEFSLY